MRWSESHLRLHFNDIWLSLHPINQYCNFRQLVFDPCRIALSSTGLRRGGLTPLWCVIHGFSPRLQFACSWPGINWDRIFSGRICIFWKLIFPPPPPPPGSMIWESCYVFSSYQWYYYNNNYTTTIHHFSLPCFVIQNCRAGHATILSRQCDHVFRVQGCL